MQCSFFFGVSPRTVLIGVVWGGYNNDERSTRDEPVAHFAVRDLCELRG